MYFVSCKGGVFLELFLFINFGMHMVLREPSHLSTTLFGSGHVDVLP